MGISIIEKMCKVTVPTFAWYGDISLDLVFPNSWHVIECKMAGHDTPALKDKQIRERIANPIGTRPLHDLAKGKKECVIIVDDLTRPTKASQVLPAVLDEIRKGGITDKHIRFVMALGAHHHMRLDDLIRKLGKEIPDRFHVFNHNVYENNILLGNTSQGTPVSINKEVMTCDLKIAIGGIVPHPLFGFGGGAKMILPGVASIDTIDHNHKYVRTGVGTGKVERNLQRRDAEEAARMAGLDFTVNLIINVNRDCCGLFCGNPVAAHREGVKIARKHYVTKIAPDADIVVVNGYPMENEAYKVFTLANERARSNGSVIVLIHTPEGARGHYYNGRFGMNYGGRGWKSGIYIGDSVKAKRRIIVSPHHSLKDEGYYGLGSVWVKSWAEALEKLYERHDKLSKIKVAVYPCAAIQISEKNVVDAWSNSPCMHEFAPDFIM